MTTSKTAEDLEAWVAAARFYESEYREAMAEIDRLQQALTQSQAGAQGWRDEHGCSETTIRRAKLWVKHTADRYPYANEPRTVLKLLESLTAPHVNDTNVADTAKPSENAADHTIAYVKMRLAMIASQDYKTCGYTAEDVAMDAIAKLEGVDVAHPVKVRTYEDGLLELLKRAETEMRYAGWDKPNAENVAREPLYLDIVEAVEAEIGGAG